MSILYSKSNANSDIVTNSDLIQKNLHINLIENKDLFRNNNLQNNEVFKIYNESNYNNILIITDKELTKNNFLYNLKNESNILYWKIGKECIDKNEINLENIKNANSKLEIKEIFIPENKSNLFMFSGNPSVILNILINCENYEAQNIIDNMISMYIVDE